jgi:hypothetical protein
MFAASKTPLSVQEQYQDKKALQQQSRHDESQAQATGKKCLGERRRVHFLIVSKSGFRLI